MIAPILSTKLIPPPPRPDLVPRSHLIDQLNEAVPACKLVLISAPAGFGKTSIMSMWKAGSDLPGAWLSLDRADNSAAYLLIYMVTAVRGIAPETGQTTLAMLQSSQAPSLDTALAMWINELSTIQQDFYLFLDDYHVIEAVEVHSTFTFLIDHLPPRMHLVLASRSDPPLQLSRLRARGQLLELRQADLSFTPQEAAVFFKQSPGVDLTNEQVRALEARTEGWIAGLQLAWLSLKGRQDADEFIQAFGGSHRFVIDYLADEVFSQQPQDIRHFLLETSILERFTADLCDGVTGRDDSAVVLRELEANNLFLIPLDDQREWYRFHPLWRDFLLTRLDKPSQADLHKKASLWFLSNGLSSEAVNHALASGSTDLAVEVISASVAGVFNEGGYQSVLDWLEALPDDIVRGDALLSTYKGLALLLSSSYGEALPYARAAEKSLPTGSQAAFHGQYLSLQAYIALCENRLDQCVRFSQDALEYLDEGDYFVRNLTLNVLGQVLEMKGDYTTAVKVYRQAFETGWKAGDRLGSLVVFTNLVFSLNELGRREEALDWCRQLVADGEALSLSGSGIMQAAYLSWSLLAFEANELDIAQEYAQRSLEFLSKIKFPQGASWVKYILSRIHLAKGEYERARELAMQGRRIASQLGPDFPHGVWFAAQVAQIDLELGDLPAALRWAEKVGFSPEDTPRYWLDQPYFTYARILLAQGKYGEIESLLKNMEARASQERRLRKLITIHLLDALTLDAQGQRQPALRKVERALQLASPQGYRRAFLDEGPGLIELLPIVRSTAPEFVDELLLSMPAPGLPTAPLVWLVNPLTERELEVLRLVAQGLSNRAIAERLVVTLGTVKKHLNNIFSKLYVSSRTQAVAKGRELGLLE